MTVDDARERARAHFEDEQYKATLAAAKEGLENSPDDVELLILAGRAGVETDDDQAVAYLQRATELAPDNAQAWNHLGEALATEGRTEEADAAFRKSVELDPDDQHALSQLGHTSLATGRQEEGVGYLARAADSIGGASSASISLVDMYRSFGQLDEALAQAQRIADAAPDDVLAQLDVAEISLELDNLDDARKAFDRLREIDDIPGHEAYPLHGLIAVEIRGEQWSRAKELLVQSATIDPHGLSADVAAFVEAQISGPGDEPAPTREEVDAALQSSLASYRQMHADDRRMTAGERLV
jgi:Flp pilus assembly protein TadD